MNRPTLRLVEPLSDQAGIPEMMAPETEKLVVAEPEKVAAIVQLLLLWPDYSSAVLRSNGVSAKVEVGYDESLKEVEGLFLFVSAETHSRLRSYPSLPVQLMFEVFGLEFQFAVTIEALADEYTEGEPCVAIQLPTSIERLGVRKSRRIPLEKPLALELSSAGQRVGADLVEVSPRGFKFKVAQGSELAASDRIGIIGGGERREFQMKFDRVREGFVIATPIADEPENFGPFFNLYVRYAYPMLKPRHSFPEDPVPELAVRTGQAEKFASKEQSAEWLQQIQEAYHASADAQHSFTADYIAVDEDGKPIGTSSLAKAFLDNHEMPMWAFHGLSIVQDPKNLSHTGALYLWRSDYILSSKTEERVVGWFDGKGRWLEKVYVKFQRLTPQVTDLESVQIHRHIRNQSSDVKMPNGSNQNLLKNQRFIERGRFQRNLLSSSSSILGFGIPYLNLAGGLDAIFHPNKASIESDEPWLKQCVDYIRPPRFAHVTRSDIGATKFADYDSYLLESVTRQVISSGIALSHFRSSLEHSLAVSRKKYAS